MEKCMKTCTSVKVPLKRNKKCHKNEPCILELREEKPMNKQINFKKYLYFSEFLAILIIDVNIKPDKAGKIDNLYHQKPVSRKYYITSDLFEIRLFDCHHYFRGDCDVRFVEEVEDSEGKMYTFFK